MRPFDPLDYDNLARSVVQALVQGKEQALPPSESFPGCGVYALYYRGDSGLYSAISRSDVPIYVGMALPKGARKGKSEGDTAGRELCQRLKQHSRNVECAENLRTSDFKCRFLVVVPVWITLAERFLVEHYRPVWNVLVDGFGNHPPGAGRVAMKRPRWDILHPGRVWAGKLQAEETAEQVAEQVRRFFGDNAHGDTP